MEHTELHQKNPRRSFLKKAFAGAGASVLGTSAIVYAGEGTQIISPEPLRLPREVWVASFSQQGIETENHQEMVDLILNEMEFIARYNPDIICLPETFPYSNNRSKSPPIHEIAESSQGGGPIIKRFSDFAQKHSCYIICPLHTKDEGKYYNSAVLIDRKGNIVGEYRKIHPTTGEIENGITPGPSDPPVFETDFGIIGIQICFDIKWQEAWKKLGQKNAEIVFWPSAFSGGKMIDTMSWMNQYYTVSSSIKDTTKICDLSGEQIAWTGRWNPNWACAGINLEKVFLHAWPFCERFDEVRAKYGRKVKIEIFHEEEWATIESLSPDVRVNDIMKEFEFKSQKAHLNEAEENGRKAR